MAMDFLAGAPIKELQTGTKADEQFRGPRAMKSATSCSASTARCLGRRADPRQAGRACAVPCAECERREIRSLALPGHVFRVVALDGNPVPTPTEVPVLWLGTAERISAIVEMRHPGVLVMGDLADDDRGRTAWGLWSSTKRQGQAAMESSPSSAGTTRSSARPASRARRTKPWSSPSSSTTARLNGFNQWLLNGEAFSMETLKPLYTVRQGRRYRLKFRNASDDIHPLHLHRHSFELVRVGGRAHGGRHQGRGDARWLPGSRIRLRRRQSGLTLFHCHQQLHMDFGFMALFDTRETRP